MSKKISIGGQALIEGIMMKGPKGTCIAIRNKEGEVVVEDFNTTDVTKKYKILGLPVIRGVVNFVQSMLSGYKALMYSADKSGFTDLEDEQEQDTPKSEKDQKKESLFMTILFAVAAVLGVLLAVVLFMYLPSLAFKGLNYLCSGKIYYLKGLFEGIIKMLIFVGYIAIVSLEKDIKRVFMYHGAEHKTIACFEAKEELTVQNVRKHTRFHPRCGTSFIFLMLFVSIFVTSILVAVLPTAITQNNLIWVPLKVAIIPLICGLGYELLKFTAWHDNLFTRIVVKPGLWIQRLTTKEPDDGMIEVAIASIVAVLPEEITNEVVPCCTTIEEESEEQVLEEAAKTEEQEEPKEETDLVSDLEAKKQDPDKEDYFGLYSDKD